MASYYVTTPIYYVNGSPHMGHAYSTVSADVIARHLRQLGEEVFFLTGTDEHGEPVARAAQEQGVTPQQLADSNAERFKALMPKLNISNSFFIRTSDQGHCAQVQKIMQKVYDNGYVYEGQYEGWYCPRCADFKKDSEIDDGRCPIHKIELDREQEQNYFFKLSDFQSQLEQLYAENSTLIKPNHRFNEAISFIKQGLEDISLTRSKLAWGVEVPWDKDQVFYVWFDALLNYITALSYADPERDLTDEFWPANYQIIGKDILKFHAVYWPALLLAAGYELPKQIFVHGFLLTDGEKMSKSLGNVLDPVAVVDQFGADALRFYCFREVNFGQDGSVSTAGFQTRYETELANEYGNLANRAISMVIRYRDGNVPEADLDPQLVAEFSGLTDQFSQLVQSLDLTQALELVWQRVRTLNRYVENSAPWKLAKDPTATAELDKVLYSLAEGVRIVAVLLASYMPQSSEKLLKALGCEDSSLATAEYGLIKGGSTVQKLDQLFPKEK